MKTVKVKGMTCGHCVKSVKEALEKIDGLSNVTVDLGFGQASYDEDKPVSEETVKAAIEAIGFEVE